MAGGVQGLLSNCAQRCQENRVYGCPCWAGGLVPPAAAPSPSPTMVLGLRTLGAGKPLSKCGKCRRYMKYISARPQRLYCSTCEEVLPLPQVWWWWWWGVNTSPF
jgi:hypothetical protein